MGKYRLASVRPQRIIAAETARSESNTSRQLGHRQRPALELPDESNYEEIVSFMKDLKVSVDLNATSRASPPASTTKASIAAVTRIKSHTKAEPAKRSPAIRISGKYVQTLLSRKKAGIAEEPELLDVQKMREEMRVGEKERVSLFPRLFVALWEDRLRVAVNEAQFVVAGPEAPFCLL